MSDTKNTFKVYSKTLNNVIYDNNLAAEYIDELELEINRLKAELERYETKGACPTCEPVAIENKKLRYAADLAKNANTPDEIMLANQIIKELEREE